MALDDVRGLVSRAYPQMAALQQANDQASRKLGAMKLDEFNAGKSKLSGQVSAELRLRQWNEQARDHRQRIIEAVRLLKDQQWQQREQKLRILAGIFGYLPGCQVISMACGAAAGIIAICRGNTLQGLFDLLPLGIVSAGKIALKALTYGSRLLCRSESAIRLARNMDELPGFYRLCLGDACFVAGTLVLVPAGLEAQAALAESPPAPVHASRRAWNLRWLSLAAGCLLAGAGGAFLLCARRRASRRERSGNHSAELDPTATWGWPVSPTDRNRGGGPATALS